MSWVPDEFGGRTKPLPHVSALLTGCGCVWLWLPRRECATPVTCCALERCGCWRLSRHSLLSGAGWLVRRWVLWLGTIPGSSAVHSKLQADITLKLKGVDPGSPPTWDAGTSWPWPGCSGQPPAASLLGADDAMPCRCVVTPSAVLLCLPTPGLPEQVEGAQLQRKLENDVHCDYERASWSGLFHRALGLSPAVLHRLKSEGA